MFTQNQISILMNDFKNLTCVNVTQEYGTWSKVEIEVPIEYQALFIDFLKAYDLKISYDKSEKDFMDQMRKALGCE